MKARILCLFDSPTQNTGFACVGRNLAKNWTTLGAEVEIWAIGFSGWEYQKFPWQLYPGGGGGEWSSIPVLERFLTALNYGGYTHVFIMQDVFQFVGHEFCAQLRKVCTSQNIRSLFYFPVDARWDRKWSEVIRSFDVAVAYTVYGRGEALRSAREFYNEAVRRDKERREIKPEEKSTGDGGGKMILLGEKVEAPPLPDYVEPVVHVIPHGVDGDLFHPLTDIEREKLRTQMLSNWPGNDHFIMMNVNVHQRRKDVYRSLEILKGLRDRGVPAMLLMHMANRSLMDGTVLTAVGEQLGLDPAWWGVNDELFQPGQPSVPEESLKNFYGVADMLLTTTLGEGWGLTVTEALACGIAVAMPMHTSLTEIADGFADAGMYDRIVRLRNESGTIVLGNDISRVRRRVDLDSSIDAIEAFYMSGLWRQRMALTDVARRWLSWGRIAREFWKLMDMDSLKGRTK